MTSDSARRLAFATSVVVFVALAASSPAIPVVWDEGGYLDRASSLVTWFHLIWNTASPDGGLHAFSARVIGNYWHFYTWYEGHPAFAVIPMAFAKGVLPGRVGELTAARLGTIAVFSAACGILTFHVRTTFGSVAAVMSIVALLTFPRMFSEAHFATLDAQLTAWWLILWAIDLLRRSDDAAWVRVGIVAGLTSATKFTGWLAWAPLAASRLLTRDWRHVTGLFVILLVGLLTFWIVSPPLWHHPWRDMRHHVGLNIHRPLSVPIAFFGQVYDKDHSLPWYNTLAWLAIVTPVPILILGLVGVVRCLAIRDAPSVSLLLHWATLMVVRALPGVPPHDGIRLFLPAFGFWCVLAGVGGQQLWDLSQRLTAAWGAVVIRAALAASTAADAANMARYFPQTLSHYNILVGGVRGAASLGMEPAYWWDSLDAGVLDWLNTHTDAGARVAFSTSSNLSLLNAWGRLRPLEAPPGGTFQWYVLQNRTGFLSDSDRRLIERGTPALTKYAGAGRMEDAPWDLDVPLLLVFPYEQYRAAIAGRLD